MAAESPGGQPNGAVLRTTRAGLQLIRRRKHEPIGFRDLSQEELRYRTSKVWGSKFLQEWTLETYLDRLERRLQELPWSSDSPLPRRGRHRFREDKPVGFVEGLLVHTIEVVWDGLQVHAYPVEDR